MLEFRILGPLEVLDEGRALALGGQKQRALLAFLLLDAGRVVSVDRIVDALWGERPPRTAPTSLQNFVSHLRKVLGNDILVTRPPGYLLRVEPEHFDLERFRMLVAASKGLAADERAVKLREALALWRGPPLADFALEEFAQPEIGRLEELRLAALEERIDAELEAGGHAGLVGELELLVDEHPLREGSRRQLMLALYRSGRQAEALQVYHEARRVLVDDLGIDPSRSLQEVHGAILRQDAKLDLAGDAPAAEDRFRDLADTMLGGRLVPVLGPEVAELTAHLAERFEYPLDDGPALPRVAQYVAVMKGSGPLYDEMHAVLSRDDLPPTQVHRFLAALPPLLRARDLPHQLIVSTSYDLALERAFLEAGEEFDVVSYLAAGRNRGKFCHVRPDGSGTLIDVPNEYVTELSLEQRTVILKLHGQVDQGLERAWESFVVTEDDYIDYLVQTEVASVVPVALAAKLRRSHFLFVGYTMADWNLRLLLHRLWGDQPLSYRSWAVQAEAQPLEREFWRRRDVDVLEIPLERCVATLAEYAGLELPNVNQAQSSQPPMPFKGLAPFEDSAHDASFFFGREREIEVIVANLMANRLTVLYGPSGVGKTSLLRAGLAQRLRQEPETVVVVASSWAGDPVADLLDAIENALHASGAVRRTDSLPDALGSIVRRFDTNLYLVLDQFEEYFLYHEGESGAGTLMEDLPEALRRRGLRANFLLGIREDSLAQLDAFKGRIPNLFANTLRLDRLDRRAGEAAIVGPIHEYNRLRPGEPPVEIEPELVDAVLREVATGRVDFGRSGRGGVEDEADEGRIEAPYLQLVLERLWDVEMSRGSRRLRLGTLHELGGAARIVQDHLERAMSELSPSQRDAAAAMYNHLVTPSGTKIAHRVGDLAGYAGVDEAAAGGVLSRLVDQRIVRAGGNGVGGPRYEIFHDVLADAVLAWRARHEADIRLEAEREAAEERHRRTRTFAVAAAVAVAILAAISVYALTQRSSAQSEARHARAREIAALAILQLPDDPEGSLGQALEANALEPSPRTERVLRTVLRELRVLAVLRRSGPVTSVAFSPDSEFALTADKGGEARLFRVSTGRRVRSFPHGAPLAGAALSHDGSLVVTAGDDGIAWIWKAKTGARVRPLKHGGPVTSAIFSPDDSVLATTSMDGYARIWDMRTGDLVRRLKHPGAVETASMSGDGRLLVTVLAPEANDPVARVFDTRTGRRVSQLRLRDRVTTAHFALKGDRVVAGSFGGDVRVWHARTDKLITKLPGHAQAVLDAEFSPAGDQIVTASTDHTARIWNAATGDVIAVLANQRDVVSRAHFSPDGESVVTASADGRASVFHADGGLVLATLIGHKDSVVDAVFSPDPDGTTVATASLDGTARLWDPHTDPLLQTVGSHRDTINSIAFSPDGRFFASGGDDRDVRIWRAGGGLVKTLATGGPVKRVVFSRDGSLLLGVSADVAVRVWRTSDWTRVAAFRHRFAVTGADLSPDARFVASADADGVIRLWALDNPDRQRWMSARGPRVDVVAFSPDSKLLVTAGADKVARLRRVDDGRVVQQLRGHHREVVLASFSPDGHRLVTASKDRTARIWNTATGTSEHELRGHGRTITSASFSPDSRLVVTTGSDHKSHVWLAESGMQLKPLKQGQIVMGASFSADGRWLATAGPYAGVWATSDSDKLLLLKPRAGLLTAIAFSPTGSRIVTGGIDGSVQTYVCQLCGRDRQLVALAKARLARLHR